MISLFNHEACSFHLGSIEDVSRFTRTDEFV
jgi:hypothetical protein